MNFSKIIVVNDPSVGIHSMLQKKHPRSRVFLWGGDGGDLKFYHTLLRDGVKVIAHSSLQKEVEARLGVAVASLRDVDESIDTAIGKCAASCERPAPQGPILFCPCNDTHSHMFAPVAKHLMDTKFLLADVRPGENAEKTLLSLGVEPIIATPERIDDIKPSVVVLGNDWNQTMRKVVARARALRIPTVCLQEGCLDFDTQDRMAIADFPMIQGPIMPCYLSRPIYLPTGNPRFDSIKQVPLPKKPLVMINCNFTYGVHEDQRDKWVRDVADACRKLNLEYFISQHPRDKGKFPDDPVRPSHAGVVHQQLAESSLLVTRFSTLVYEAMLMGRRVLYYNPFGEKMRLFNEDRTDGLLKAFDANLLPAAMEQAAAAMDDTQQDAFDRFLALHCGTADGAAAQRVASALQWIAECANPMPKRGLLARLGF